MHGKDDERREGNVQTEKIAKRPGQASSSMVFGVLGLLLFFLPVIGFLLGIAALASGHAARRKIKRSSEKMKGMGISTTGFVLGIIDTVVGIIVLLIAIPNYIHMGERPKEYTVRQNMFVVQFALADYANSDDGNFPTSMDDTNTQGKKFSEYIQLNRRTDDVFTNPFTHNAPVIEFMGKAAGFPADDEVVSIPPGEIRIFSDGKRYIVMAGGKDGRSLSVRLSSED